MAEVNIMTVEDATVLFDGIITIVYKEKAKKIYGEAHTLRECYGIATENEDDTSETILVIHENPLNGVIYRYGNHGKYWEVVGKMGGYA